MILNPKIYNILKWIVLYFLPAFGTLYFSISQIWGIPNSEQILGTISSTTIFLSMILGLSNSAYKKAGTDMDGTMLIDRSDPDKDVYLLQLKDEAIDLSNKEFIKFKVDNKAKLE